MCGWHCSIIKELSELHFTKVHYYGNLYTYNNYVQAMNN